jgi:hypothetical protein
MTVYKAGNLAQMEEIQKAYTHIFAHFAEFREIFSTGQNKIVGTMMETVSHQV